MRVISKFRNQFNFKGGGPTCQRLLSQQRPRCALPPLSMPRRVRTRARGRSACPVPSLASRVALPAGPSRLSAVVRHLAARQAQADAANEHADGYLSTHVRACSLRLAASLPRLPASPFRRCAIAKQRRRTPLPPAAAQSGRDRSAATGPRASILDRARVWRHVWPRHDSSRSITALHASLRRRCQL